MDQTGLLLFLRTRPIAPPNPVASSSTVIGSGISSTRKYPTQQNITRALMVMECSPAVSENTPLLVLGSVEQGPGLGEWGAPIIVRVETVGKQFSVSVEAEQT